MHRRRFKSLVIGFVVVIGLMPGAALAQSSAGAQQACGVQLPVATDGEVLLQQPNDLGQHDRDGTVDYSAVRGSIVHLDGPLALVQIDGAGVGNATSNHELAGDSMAVVRLPAECDLASFGNGTAITAIGTPTEQGILDAVTVLPA
jgi:hypothetical protein